MNLDLSKLNNIFISKEDINYINENLNDAQVGQVLKAVMDYFYSNTDTTFANTLVDTVYRHVLQNTIDYETKFIQNCKRPTEFYTEDEIEREQVTICDLPVAQPTRLRPTAQELAYDIANLILCKPGTYELKPDAEIKKSYKTHISHLESKYNLEEEFLAQHVRAMYEELAKSDDTIKLEIETVKPVEHFAFSNQKPKEKIENDKIYTLDDLCPKPEQLYEKTIVKKVGLEERVGNIQRNLFENVLSRYNSYEEAKRNKLIQEWLENPQKSGINSIHIKHYYTYKNSQHESAL